MAKDSRKVLGVQTTEESFKWGSRETLWLGEEKKERERKMMLTDAGERR